MPYFLHLKFTDVLEMQLRIFCEDSYAKIAQDFALTEDDVKKTSRLLREEFARQARPSWLRQLEISFVQPLQYFQILS